VTVVAGVSEEVSVYIVIAVAACTVGGHASEGWVVLVAIRAV